MREIKFRVWDLESGQIRDAKSLYLPLGDPSGKNITATSLDEDTDLPLPDDGEKVNGVWQWKNCEWVYDYGPIMQYTGLKDKNGVEIYEGDICLLPNGEKRFVRYDAPSFYLAKSDDLVDVDAFSTPGIYEEVIGNIYENKELLNAT